MERIGNIGRKTSWLGFLKSSENSKNFSVCTFFTNVDGSSDILDFVIYWPSKNVNKNIKNASLKNKINLNVNAFENSKPTQDSGIIVTNPPYGERMKKIDLDNFYKQIGDHLKKEYSGFDAWVISGNMEALKNIGLHTSRKIKLFNGPLECRFNKFSIYEGSKKARKLD